MEDHIPAMLPTISRTFHHKIYIPIEELTNRIDCNNINIRPRNTMTGSKSWTRRDNTKGRIYKALLQRSGWRTGRHN
jgi:hypothetical protein